MKSGLKRRKEMNLVVTSYSLQGTPGRLMDVIYESELRKKLFSPKSGLVVVWAPQCVSALRKFLNGKGGRDERNLTTQKRNHSKKRSSRD